MIQNVILKTRATREINIKLTNRYQTFLKKKLLTMSRNGQSSLDPYTIAYDYDRTDRGITYATQVR